jgi:hypothetical protein
MSTHALVDGVDSDWSMGLLTSCRLVEEPLWCQTGQAAGVLTLQESIQRQGPHVK